MIRTVNRTRAGSRTREQLFDDLTVSPDTGLSLEEARQRLGKYDPNRLREAESIGMAKPREYPQKSLSLGILFCWTKA
jgi:hypothetical protein